MTENVSSDPIEAADIERFFKRLTAQYELARQAHGLADEALAELARMSVRGSAAPPPVRARLLAGIDAWLAAPEPDCPPQSPAGRSGTRLPETSWSTVT